MEPAPEDCRLEDCARHHRVATGIFVPFAIVRLCGEPRAEEMILAVRLRDVRNPGEVRRRLRLIWSVDKIPMQPLGVQENTVTEWAALAIASAVLPFYAGLRLRAVAFPGNSFDYWVTDGTWQYGLEVSGTMTEDMETRHREKVRQLRSNPYGLDGYVVTACFPLRTVIFSFHPFAEGVT
jgi:hypothetical protein